MNTKASELVLSVGGMSCGSCVRHVREALLGVSGVRKAEVDLAQGSARVEYDPDGSPSAVLGAAMVAAVGKAGYTAAVRGGDDDRG